MSEQHKVDSKILERVKKILTKTEERGCTPAEAEAAFAMASRMLAEHNLTIADVSAGSKEAEDPFAETTVFECKRWMHDKSLIWSVVHKHCFVEGFFRWTTEGYKRLVLFGRASNVETAVFVWNALDAATTRLWLDYQRRTVAPGSDRRVYVVGVLRGFSDKMDDERKAMEVERDMVSGNQGGTALALRNITAENMEAYKEKHGKPLTYTNGNHYTKISNRSAYGDGYEAGRRLNINRSVGQGGKQAIGG